MTRIIDNNVLINRQRMVLSDRDIWVPKSPKVSYYYWYAYRRALIHFVASLNANRGWPDIQPVWEVHGSTELLSELERVLNELEKRTLLSEIMLEEGDTPLVRLRDTQERYLVQEVPDRTGLCLIEEFSNPGQTRTEYDTDLFLEDPIYQ